MGEDSDKNEALSVLKRQRGSAKGNITRIKNILMEPSASNFDHNDLQCRLEILTSYMDQLMSFQSQIEMIDFEDNKRAELEELCISAKSKLLSLLGRQKRKESTVMDSTLGITLPPPTRLPNLKLPSFKGKYCNYKNFISSFNNLVHDEPTLSPIEKFNHLLSCLTGDAYMTVQAFEVSDENYPKALARLAERYDKKSLIFFDTIENLFEIPKMLSPDASSLRNAVDTVSAMFGSLESLGSHKEIANALIIHLVLSKVDFETRSKWNEQLDYSVLPNWDDCANILIRRCQSLEVNDEKRNRNDRTINKRDRKRNSRLVFSCSQTSSEKACLYCKAPNHSLQDCGNFASVSVADRFDFAKKNSCCLNCLKVGHGVAKCKAARCKICKKPHHQLLHRYTALNQVSGTENSLSVLPSTSQAANQFTAMHVYSNFTTVLLATAVVRVVDRLGNVHNIRTLLDSGSQLNLISEECSRRLGLKFRPNNIDLNGVGSISVRSNYKVTITVRSRVNEYKFQEEFSVVDSICSYQPENSLAEIEDKIPNNLQLADPNFNKSQKVDMLLGADIFFEILSVGQIRLGELLPKLHKTLLGWIVAGKARAAIKNDNEICNIVENTDNVDMDALDRFVNKFWDIEEVPNKLCKFSEEHLECEAHYKKNTRILESGRFEVRLPFKGNPSELGVSFEVAKRRFLSLERRLIKTPDVKELYLNFMKEYISMGHMSEVESVPPGPHYFIPHQCVLRPQSLTTKLRVVFDASCRTSSQLSLNEILMVGPTIQPELYCTLLRFRCYKYAMTADITKMYRQIMMNQDDRKFQIILWRENENMPIKMYSLNTVTYGTGPAPFLAIRCLKELSDRNKEKYPLGSSVIENHFYVDDLLTGADTIQELGLIKNEVVSILKSGCLELAKWYCNDKSLNINQNLEKQLVVGEMDSTKTLGMTWFPNEDLFQFKIDFDFENLKATKRNILSLSARLFDPLGILSPIILQAKIILQELWREKLDWDESVPMSIETSWQNFKLTLAQIDKIKVPRYVNTLLHNKVQIHGFADASENAYGCCLYIRAIINGKVVVNLLTAKSKVAPLKKRNLPRLELCAAHLLSKLWKAVEAIMLPYVEKVFFWSDSEIVLYWLKKYPASLSTFVGNRVADIQEWASSASWKHVPTKSNPADIVSRGCNVNEICNSIWFEGPPFLLLNEDMWPSNNHIEPSDEQKNLEIRKSKATVLLIKPEENVIMAIIEKCSSYIKILRIVAYIYRFVQPKDKKNKNVTISAEELNAAFLKIIETIQTHEFSNEIKCVKNQVVIKSSIQKLNPFLHQVNIGDRTLEVLRVGGRLLNAPLEYDTKFPILVPRASKFIELYARYLHFKNCHAGPKVLLSLLRQNVWVINGRELTRKIVRNCIHCFRYKPKLLSQIMGNLPRDRFQVARPFLVSGVDFCGPIYTSYKIRGRPPYKSYVAIFVCFSSKAVHIEPVSDLSTNAFISVFKRFVGRRGLPARIYCDNATNFVGANAKLKEVRDVMFSEENQTKIHNFVAENGVKFVFIPPRAPHFGGLWEAAVKSTKNLLYRTVANASLTFEQLATILVEIEAILNSRPIAPMSDNPNDGDALTPGHLLIGSSMKALPEICEKNPGTSAKQWQQISDLKARFWDAFQRDYVVELQGRMKWSKPCRNVEVDAMVLVHEDNVPPQKWLYGRVVTVVAAEDGKVRVVDIKTRNGVIRRAIHKLALLPV